MQQCAIGEFALLKHNGEDFPSYVMKYAGSDPARVEVCVITRKRVAVAEIESLERLHPSAIRGGLTGFPAIHGEYGTGIIVAEAYIADLLFLILERPGEGDSGLVPITEIVLGSP